MQYAVLIYDKPGTYEAIAPEELERVMAEYGPLTLDPAVRGGAQLQPAQTATTVRVKGDETLVSDGPFADTKEVFGGFYLIDMPDLEAAVAFAARIPSARLGGSVEVRPIVDRGAIETGSGAER